MSDDSKHPNTEGSVHADLIDPASLSRRGFLTLGGATAAAVALEACVRRPVENILPYSRGVEHIIPGVPLHFATVTERRGDSLGILVTSHEGRPTKVEGNPDHAGSSGGTDLHAQASLMDLYDPDRSTSPATRVGEALEDRSWAQFDAALSERIAASEGGRGLHFLVRLTNSPTFARLRGEVLARLPEARFHVYAPVNEDNARRGIGLAFEGPADHAAAVPRTAQTDFAATKVILSLDSDFLGTEPSAVRSTRSFANGRRLTSASGEMSRLYVVEPALTVTGANADHRLALAGRSVGGYLVALCRQLLVDHADVAQQLEPFRAVLADPGLDVPSAWTAAVARDLARNTGAAAVVVGSRQPAWVHALAVLLNRALGNEGRTITYRKAPDVGPPSQAAGLSSLARAMRDGAVQSLVILGGNPAHDAPSDAAFGEALGDVEVSFHVSSHRNETSDLATWHAPRAHELESWGDQLAVDGTLAIQQPLIAPLHSGRSDIQVLATVLGGSTSDYEAVRATIGARLGAGFDAAWRRALHAGVAVAAPEPSQAPFPLDGLAIAEAVHEAEAAPAAASNSLEVAFVPCTKLIDGAHANNTWLLELPDPLTKVTWDNAALMSPRTATELDVSDGDFVRLSREGAGDIEVPVLTQPGHADFSLTLALGWGRARAGRYGGGHGFDVYPLRTSDDFWFASGVRLERTERPRHIFAQTQTHASEEDRPLAITGTLAEYRDQPEFPSYQSVEMAAPPLWEAVDYTTGSKWGLNIDLNACTGCNTCVVACQAENNIPVVGKRQVMRGREMHWLRIDRYIGGTDAEPTVEMQPVACQQCEEAPCENVCPVNATSHSPEGLNDMAYNRCIGTRYCGNNCPYKVRRFNYMSWHGYLDGEFGDYEDFPETRKMQFNPNVTVRMRGVMEKCTYCVQRIEAAKIAARREHRELADGDITTACEQVCPAQAIVFGSLNESQLTVKVDSALVGKTVAEVRASELPTLVALRRGAGDASVVYRSVPDSIDPPRGRFDVLPDAMVVEAGDVLLSTSRVAQAANRDRNYKLLAEVGTRPRTTFLARIRNPNPEMVG